MPASAAASLTSLVHSPRSSDVLYHMAPEALSPEMLLAQDMPVQTALPDAAPLPVSVARVSPGFLLLPVVLVRLGSSTCGRRPASTRLIPPSLHLLAGERHPGGARHHGRRGADRQRGGGPPGGLRLDHLRPGQGERRPLLCSSVCTWIGCARQLQGCSGRLSCPCLSRRLLPTNPSSPQVLLPAALLDIQETSVDKALGFLQAAAGGPAPAPAPAMA